jgi:hypothetical protein
MLAYNVKWHPRERLKLLLFDDEFLAVQPIRHDLTVVRCSSAASSTPVAPAPMIATCNC